MEGTCGHFYQVETGVVDVKTNLLYQIGRARSFVLVEYAFDVEDEEDIEGKKTMIEDMFVSVLNDLEGIILIQNQEEKEDSMFCCGENGEKLLILSDKGGSAFTRYLPYQEPDLKAGKDITQEQVDRRMRTMQMLIEMCIRDRGVENALASSYTGEYPIITGQDCDIANVKNLIAGKQAMSVFKDTRTLASQVVKMVDAVMQGGEAEVNDTQSYDNGTGVIPTYLCEPVVVTIDNYKEMLIDSGYYLSLIHI